MLSFLTKKRSPRSKHECDPVFFNWHAFSTRQVRLPTRRQQLRRNAANALNLGAIFIFQRCHSRATMKNLTINDLEILVKTKDFQKQVDGYGLTTANILYRRPDHPWLLQSYLWQNYDLYPDFPELQGFLEFWQKSLEGVLHSVTVAHSHLIKPVEIKTVDGIFRLH
jgi:uncharacterized protein Usg